MGVVLVGVVVVLVVLVVVVEGGLDNNAINHSAGSQP